jgi:hypothetical protein
MGQLVGVVEKPSSQPAVIRLELNRNLTGVGHERFSSAADAVGPRPAAALARELFATGKVEWVHAYMNMVTIDLVKGYDSSGLADIARELYRYWKPGVEPPAFEDLQPAEEAPPAATGDGGGGDAELSEAAKRVPPHLLERSRAAREKWKAKQG